MFVCSFTVIYKNFNIIKIIIIIVNWQKKKKYERNSG